MNKLIGTDPNQVPNNADLGSAAFMDKKDFLQSRGSTIASINAVIENEVRDVYIYDTSKDSDSGAWRKRTSHTSWYNETLNTPTRGSRREFPSVALIVTEATRVVIYDADDPALPMWMVFEMGPDLSNETLIRYSGNMKETRALNAVFCFVSADCPVVLNFINEKHRLWHENNSYRFVEHRGIVDRNTYSTEPDNLNTSGLKSNNGHAVSMTVLPNAPIDKDTGLPCVTMAFGTQGGVTVIKNDSMATLYDSGLLYHGTSSNGTAYDICRFVHIDENYRLWYSMDSTERDGFVVNINDDMFTTWTVDVSTNDATIDAFSFSRVNEAGEYILPSTNGTSGTIRSITDNAVGAAEGLTIFNNSAQVYDDSRVEYGEIAHVTTDYNTGMIPGRTSYLIYAQASKDSQDLYGDNLVTNGTFTTDTSGWTGSNSTLSNPSAQLLITGTATAGHAWQDIMMVAGKTYVISGSITFGSTFGAGFQIYNYTDPTTTVVGVSRTGNGSGNYSGEYTATVTGMHQLRLYHSVSSGTGFTITYDNIEVRLAEPDRSPQYSNAIPVQGLIRKTPVNTGSETVSLSGFTNAGNYMRRNYTSASMGNPGSVTFMAWQRISDISDYSYIASLVDTNTNTRIGAAVGAASSSNPGQMYLWDSVNSSTYSGSNATINDGNWHHTVYVLNGSTGRKELYLDGKWVANANVGNVNLSGITQINIGHYTTDGSTVQYSHSGEIALIRITESVVSDDQVTRIYEMERSLFYPDAKCTLYGTSNTVNTVAYDRDTRLLHAGTSSGRSVFQGLRRVDNTTDEITQSISASGGMIAEE